VVWRHGAKEERVASSQVEVGTIFENKIFIIIIGSKL